MKTKNAPLKVCRNCMPTSFIIVLINYEMSIYKILRRTCQSKCCNLGEIGEDFLHRLTKKHK